jgi:C1A family cysteine protease
MSTRDRRISLVLLILAVLAVVPCSAILPAKPALAAAGAPSAAAPSAPLQAPLDPAFVAYQAQFPLGTPQWVATGLGFGLRPDPVDLSYARGLTKTRALDGAYPASFDLRNAGKVTSVKNQNPYGTCWTFASLGSLESCLMPAQNLDFSEDNMVLTSGFDTGLTPALEYDYGGQLYMSTAYVARWSGPVYETDDAYGDGITPPGLTARVHVQDVSWFPARPATPQVPSTTENNDIKYAVTTYGACYVAMKWAGSGSYDSAYLKIQGMPNAAYYDDQSMAGNSGYVEQGHAVLVVGWNDDFPATDFAITAPGNGAFLVKNSWGPAWGPSGGYFWVSYYDTKFARTSAVGVFNGVEPVANHSAIYQYDLLGWTQSTGWQSPIGWFANVFTAQTTDTVTAVGFYAVAPSTAYTVYAGASLSTLAPCTSGTLATIGYHTVTLPTGVPITAGQAFVIAVKATAPGALYPIPIEQPRTGYSSMATASAGQSYISPNGTSWGDLPSYTDYAGSNVCLKAYTSGQAAPADTTAPATTAGGIPASGWSSSPVTVSLSATDAGSGTAYTEYSLDGGAYTRGTSAAVSLTGPHTLAFRSADNAGNVEAVQTATIGIDPDGPWTVAYNNVTVKKGKLVRFRFKVVDLTPTADVEIRIYKKARLIKRLAADDVKTGSLMVGSWKCILGKGTYAWKVYATDLAGNPPHVIGRKTLVVR